MRAARAGGMVAVLFTDLVGSTELLSKLGEGAFDRLRRDHFAQLRAAVAGAGGDEVKTLGDGILAVFGSAAEAVAAAVAAQQAVERHGRQSGVPLALRTGLALGDVAFEEEDVFGTPVVEAARLAAKADPGQILATAVVRMVAGGRASAKFTDLGPIELKGLPEPVAVCEVAWESAAPASVPLPSLLAGIGRIFVGRDEELERCTQRWKEATAGERRVALLAGEPGIGKTRLATELARRVHGEGALVLAGRCDEDLGVPYQPFVEALRHYVAHAAPFRLGRHGGELTRLVPEIAERVPGLPEPLSSDPETERYRLFDAVAAWLADASAESPVLLVLDDLHWATKPTILLLRHVLRSPESLRLLVIVTYRDTDIGRGHPLSEFLADMRRESGVDRCPLTGFDQAAIGAYMEARAGHPIAGEEGVNVASAIWRETDGNPFFVTEVLRHLTESGGFAEQDGRWVPTATVAELGIPEGIRDVVGRRLSRLGESTNRVLSVASVGGLEFDPAVVRAAGGFEEDDLFSALEEAAAARLLVELPGSRFRFAHALVRTTLYDELSGPRRVSLHRRVAEAIEAIYASDLDPHLPTLSHHWARASAPAADTTRAVDYATRAGDLALAQLAHDEAVAYYRSAIELLDAAVGPPDEARRLLLLIALGDAQRRAGLLEHRQTLLDAAGLAQQRNDADSLARAALANCRGAFFSAIGILDAERVAVLEAALNAVSAEESPRRARLLANLAIELVAAGDRPRRVALSDEALALARRVGDLRTLADVLLARVYTIQAPETLTERLAITAELTSVADRLQDPIVEFQSAFLRVRCVVETGDTEEADRCVAIMERLAGELGQPELRWFAGWFRAARLLSTGRLAEADRLSREGLELGQVDAAQVFAIIQFQLLFDAGRLGEVEETLVGVLTRAPGLVIVELMLATMYCELDRDDEARAIFEPLAANDFADVPRDYTWIRSMGFCASLTAHLGDFDAAQVVYELLVPYRDQIVVTGGVFAGAVVHYLGVLSSTVGRWDEAEGHFVVAEATHERIDAPSWLARTRLEWARMLLTRREPGDAEQARLLLTQALTTAREMGFGNIERRAVALLEQAG